MIESDNLQHFQDEAYEKGKNNLLLWNIIITKNYIITQVIFIPPELEGTGDPECSESDSDDATPDMVLNSVGQSITLQK